jgi:putative cell wall-binding protein
VGVAAQIAFVASPTRTGGADRYATAALIYNQKFGAAGVAVIASGANFPDALSATVLAKAKSTGVLLTDPNTLPSSTQQVLINGSIGTVYIVGGPAAVSDAVATQIAGLKNPNSGLTLNVVRVSGQDRYATNQAVDLQSGVNGTTGGTALIATGENFADALAAGPAIYATGDALILTPSATLGTSAQATVQALGITNAIILGGTSAVSSAVETSLKGLNVTIDNRLAGADRTLTAAEIAKWELTVSPAVFAETGYNGDTGLSFDGSIVDIARGDTFPDALASGAWLGSVGVKHVLLLTGDPNTLGAGIPALLNGSVAKYGTANINGLGLASALSATTLTAAVGAIS